MAGNNGHLVASGCENAAGGTVLFDTLSLTFSASGYCDELFLISMDTSGSALWAKTLDSTSTVEEYAPKVAVDDSGNVYLSLYSEGDIMYFADDTLLNIPSNIDYSAILKYDASGIPQWGIGYYTSNGSNINDMLISPLEDLIVCGRSYNSSGTVQFGNFTLDVTGTVPCAVKLNPAGVVQWFKTSTQIGTASARFNRLSLTTIGEYAVTGSYPSEIAFNVPFQIGCYPAPLGSQDILTFVLSENPEPIPAADFDLLFEGGVAYFENTSINYDTLQWIFGDGQTDHVKRNPSHSYPVPGVYSACLVASNGCGNDTACTTVLVSGIEKATPDHLASTGYHLVNITGGFPFETGDLRFVKSGEPDIIPDTLFFRNSGLIQANLKLDSVALGDWDLVITSGSFIDTLIYGITVEQPDTFAIEVQISGAEKTLVNSWWPNDIVLTNKSNQTQIGIPLYLTFSPDAEVLFMNTEIGDSVSLAFTDTAGHLWHVVTDSIAGDSVLFGALLIPYLSPGESQVLNLLVKILNTGMRTITAQVGNSYFDEQNLFDMGLRSACNFLPKCAQCAMDWLGFVPGVGCVTGAFNLGCTIGNAAAGAPGGGFLDLVGATAGTFLSCAGPLGAIDDVGKAFAAAAGIGDFGSSAAGTFDDCGANGCHPNYPYNWTWNSVGALDPNSKTGPLGFTPQNYISGEETMHFFIHFENLDTATAPAREVIIYDTLDASVFDVSTFRFTSFAFGDSLLELNIEDNLFATDIDLRLAKNIILRVTGFLDTLSHVITWKFQSFDTLNYELTLNVDDGFLPPNINRPEGEGYVTYSVEPVSRLAHLQQLTNSSTIVIDSNEPIITNTYVNTIDTLSPSSKVNPNPVFANDTTFLLTWSGLDAHAGVNGYDIYVSVNDSAFVKLFKATTKTSAWLTGSVGSQYEFYSVAMDLANNRETPPSAPDVTVATSGIVELLSQTAVSIYPNPTSDALEITCSVVMSEIRVYDVMGKEIFKSHFLNKSKHFKLQTSDYPKGIYVLEIISVTGKAMEKFIKME